MEKMKLVIAMLIVGSIGIFVHFIAMPSAVVAAARAIIGTLFLLLTIISKRTAIQWKFVKQNAIYLIISGAAIGFNWIFLFEAYQYTTVAVATLCYYMAPAFVILLAPIVLKEKLTPLNILCTLFALLGAVLISGVLGGSGANLTGVFYGLLAAVLYASIMILNKKMKGLSGLELTFFQLTVATCVMLPYVLITEDLVNLLWTPQSMSLLLIVGIIHTGLVYQLFFSAMNQLPAQTSSLLSYIDPIAAIFLSAWLLQEKLSPIQVMGTVLILGSALVNELLVNRSKKLAKQQQFDPNSI
ncbi:EamA family transporter [Aerococcaceae bacterium DSM 109653]|uniref:EamA family transporter n=1 Tax=Fundicoccus ignavus TaxID=2664442 RepID=A0A6I2GH25_9LACT|nr:DMT family transporter [Fundicoccus ignavus]MRI81697.1 EamA family transporter [Fundicoccus ignavus]MRI85994.1 EamA family transporter [Fundicoccus ignavus]